MLLHQFSNSENIIVMSINPPLHIASSYLPPYDTLEQELTPITNVLTTVKPINFIWGPDANSKHSMWYSPITDTRGRVLVDFLSQHDLLTANEKNGPTYSGPTGESWIDITVTNINSALKIQNWEISEESTHSDHNVILFNIRILSNNTKSNRVVSNSTRNFATQVGNWNPFTLQVQQNSQQWTDLVNSARTQDELDKSITEIWSKLGEICKKCFPPFLPKTKYAPWRSP
jgi:hypothetical protein